MISEFCASYPPAANDPHCYGNIIGGGVFVVGMILLLVVVAVTWR